MGLSFFPKFVCFAITGGKERWQILSTSMGGLQRTWSKIKAYLATWKTTNFGSGTFEVDGEVDIANNMALYLFNSQVFSYILSKSHGMIIASAKQTSNFMVTNHTGMIMNWTIIYGGQITSGQLAKDANFATLMSNLQPYCPVIFVW